MSDIPIKNIYYMILYAFDKVKNKKVIDSKSFENLDTATDVIIELFLREVSMISKRGIAKEYLEHEDKSLFVKGKVNVSENIKTRSPLTAIKHDRLTHDIVINRNLKKVMHTLLIQRTINNRLKRKINHFYTLFDSVTLTEDLNEHYTLNRMNKYYEFALSLGFLIYNRLIPAEEEGKYDFINIMKDDETMSTLFEAFLRNFYSMHTKDLGYKVSRRNYHWYLNSVQGSDTSMLPKMETDVEILLAPSNKIIMDAKYYHNALISRYETKKLCSSNMYQINTYLDHNATFKDLRGILLYPANGFDLNEIFESDKGYRIEFRTVDLNKNWNEIENRLMSIIK